jgi:hypothetical protein
MGGQGYFLAFSASRAQEHFIEILVWEESASQPWALWACYSFVFYGSARGSSGCTSIISFLVHDNFFLMPDSSSS